jgi:CheY-like chemotaxis protein
MPGAPLAPTWAEIRILMSKTTALRLVTTKTRRALRPTHTTTDLVDSPVQAASAGLKRPSRATIMVVEDDAVVGRILAKALEFAGYRVRIAATGREACALQPRIRLDLIILDLMLPDMDGFALTTTLKAMGDTPIIFCSARHGQIDRALGMRLGAADFVAKPFDLDDFQRRIDAVIPRVRKT